MDIYNSECLEIFEEKILRLSKTYYNDIKKKNNKNLKNENGFQELNT